MWSHFGSNRHFVKFQQQLIKDCFLFLIISVSLNHICGNVHLQTQLEICSENQTAPRRRSEDGIGQEEQNQNQGGDGPGATGQSEHKWFHLQSFHWIWAQRRLIWWSLKNGKMSVWWATQQTTCCCWWKECWEMRRKNNIEFFWL